MRSRPTDRPEPLRALAAAALLACTPVFARAQDAPKPAAPRPDDVAERLRKLEEANRKILAEFEKLAKKNGELSKENARLSKTLDNLKDKLEDRDDDERDKEARAAAVEVSGRESSSSSTGGGGGGFRNRKGAQVVGNRQVGNLRLKSVYDYDNGGFKFSTEDDEFTLRFRGVFQGDAKLFQQANQFPVSSGFYIPRVRLYFTGHMTRPVQYQLSFQDSFGSSRILNAFVDFDYFDEKLQFRFGRFKTPYTYEFYKLSAMDLLAPERSLFSVNFSTNRAVGGQVWGRFLDKRVEYAVGIFDGARNSYQAFSSSADLIAFLNVKPFEGTGGPLENLNLGGSGAFGHEDNPLVPAVLRTSINASADTVSLSGTGGANFAAVPFLAFHDDVKEKGARSLWELHLAYFYKSLALLGAWESGFDSFAARGQHPVRLPVEGYFVQVGYLITGETQTELTVIDPIHPFDLRHGRFGWGAIQPTARFSQLGVGRQVFTQGLADPNLWTNSVYQTDVGFNWYLNKMTKLYFDWEHAVFGQPVYYHPGPKLQTTSDLFWLRFQLYF
ncbi:MAG TPA: porin [Isosphaeraceae bacterium]|jgi:phosphate-selective porin OprO/OprP|nr:porin [Isosphaeraceae bacterium]